MNSTDSKTRVRYSPFILEVMLYEHCGKNFKKVKVVLHHHIHLRSSTIPVSEFKLLISINAMNEHLVKTGWGRGMGLFFSAHTVVEDVCTCGSLWHSCSI